MTTTISVVATWCAWPAVGLRICYGQNYTESLLRMRKIAAVIINAGPSQIFNVLRNWVGPGNKVRLLT